jgi:hypothetical protein
MFDRHLGRNSDPRRDFADRIIAGLRAGGFVGSISYDPEKFCLVLSGQGETSTALLANHYATYEKTPEAEREARFAFILRSILAVGEPGPTSLDECRALLMPSIRSWAEIEVYSLHRDQQGVKPAQMPALPFAGGLAITLGIDTPENIKIVMQHQFESWNIPLEEAVAIARENLRMRSSDLFARMGPHLYASPWHDSYDSARLLLPELFDGINVPGTLLAMPDSRERLLITGSSSPEGLSGLAAAATEFKPGMRPLSTEVLQWSGTSWVPFPLDPTDPSHRPLLDLQIQERHRQYQQQKELLDELHERSGTDIFVASHQFMHWEGGELRSYAIWPEDVESLLPRTDRLILCRSDQNLGIIDAPWPIAARHVGARFAATAFHPERIHVRGFPSEAELESLLREPEVVVRPPRGE